MSLINSSYIDLSKALDYSIKNQDEKFTEIFLKKGASVETLTNNKCLVDTFDRNFQFNVEHVILNGEKIK